MPIDWDQYEAIKRENPTISERKIAEVLQVAKSTLHDAVKRRAHEALKTSQTKKLVNEGNRQAATQRAPEPSQSKKLVNEETSKEVMQPPRQPASRDSPTPPARSVKEGFTWRADASQALDRMRYRLRQMGPTLGKQQISKVRIMEELVLWADAELEKDGLESWIANKLLT
jgi:hypothetical protein